MFQLTFILIFVVRFSEIIEVSLHAKEHAFMFAYESKKERKKEKIIKTRNICRPKSSYISLNRKEVRDFSVMFCNSELFIGVYLMIDLVEVLN